MKKIDWAWLSLPTSVLANVYLMTMLLKSISEIALSSEDNLRILGIGIFASIAISLIVIAFIIIYNLIARKINKKGEE